MGNSCTGDEYSGWPNDEDRECHDCGTPPGGIHHPGCDAERCKECDRQMIGDHAEDCSVGAAIEDYYEDDDEKGDWDEEESCDCEDHCEVEE